MRIAHVRERNAPLGTGWRMAAARDPAGTRWLDLEHAREVLVGDDPRRAHNAVLFRQPVTTLDAHLARGLRVEALAEIVDGYTPAADADEGIWDATELAFGPPILHPPSLRDFYAFEQHVGTMWRRRGHEIPEAWYRLPIFYFGNTSEIRGPDEPVWAPSGSAELDYELEVAALVDTPAVDCRMNGPRASALVAMKDCRRGPSTEETTSRLGRPRARIRLSIGPGSSRPTS